MEAEKWQNNEMLNIHSIQLRLGLVNSQPKIPVCKRFNQRGRALSMVVELEQAGSGRVR